MKNQQIEHISIYINASPQQVYQFAGNPKNLPQWAAGLANSEVSKQGDNWLMQAPFGLVKVRFIEANPYGVLDHWVELESGVQVYNPMRVIQHGAGSEFIFTLIRQSEMTDDAFEQDKQAVIADLTRLKTVLEASLLPIELE